MSSPEDPKFELWLETELGEPPDQPANRPHKNFANCSVTLEDGRTYYLNVWTFDFLPLARRDYPYEESAPVTARYLFPPDLFVEDLRRETLEEVFTELLRDGLMNDAWLGESRLDTPPDDEPLAN